MVIEKENYHKTFNDDVLSIFGKIAEDYGLKLNKDTQELFTLSLEKFEVKICLQFGHLPDLNIIIVPTNKEQMPKDFLGIGLLNFVEYLDPHYHYIDFRLKTPDELHQKLDMFASLLLSYCSPFFKGDFSLWPKVVAFVEDKIKSKQLLKKKNV